MLETIVGSTLTEKILALSADKDKVSAGDFIDSKVDLVMTHDHQGPMTLLEFSKLPVKKVWDPDRVVMVIDHRTPSQTEKAAENHHLMRLFAKEQGIQNFYDTGEGVCHDLIAERGHVVPGMVFVATDSHTVTAGALGAFATGIGSSEMASVLATGRLWFMVPEAVRIEMKGSLTTGVYGKDIALHLLRMVGTSGFDYKAVEFLGPATSEISMDSRMSLCNMCLEAGAKNAIFEPDEITKDYLSQKGIQNYPILKSDKDAKYLKQIDIDLSDLEPLVAEPYSPDKVKTAVEIEKKCVTINQAIIGTCTNGRYEDIEVAARILKGKKVAQGVRLLVVPSTRPLWLRASQEGLLDIFMEAGAIVSYPCCGPCGAYGMGAMANDETCITTGSRNFVARLGAPKAKIYLGNAATVAASAVAGHIVDPRSYLKED